MSTVNNTWIGYLNRSYITIKNALLGKVTNSNPEMTDHSESNPFVIIISMFAGIAEMINYYIDNMAREGFMSTAQRRSSIIKHSYLLDYRVRARMYESVNVNFYIENSTSGDPEALAADTTIPSGTTIVSDDDNIPYIVKEDFLLVAGSEVYSVPFIQVQNNTNILLGSTNGNLNQEVGLPADYVHGTISLEIGADPYENIDTWAKALFDDKVYVVEVLPDSSIVVQFGDDTRGLLPPAGQEVRGNFFTSQGPDGKIQPDQLTTNPGGITMPPGQSFTVNNPLGSSGGAFIESTEDIRRNAVYHRRSNDRMVTRLDHKNIIETVPGVAKAKTHWCCGNTLDIYIVPEGGGIASGALISSVEVKADDKKMVGTDIKVYAAGETGLYIKLTAIAKKNRDLIETSEDINNALLEFGSDGNQDINNSIRLSDITSTVYNLEKVDFVDLEVLYSIPYANPLSHNTQLDWVRETKAGAVESVKWILEYNSGNFALIRDRTFMATIPVDTEYEDDEIKITLNSGAYTDGERWSFKTYPYNKNLFLDDFTIPKVELANLNITVKESEETNEVC